MHTVILPADRQDSLAQALETLSAGGLLAFPTDTVYGLGCSAFNRGAIDSLYAVKGRAASKAIAVLIGQVSDLALVAQEMTATARRLAEHFWPGALTLVVPRGPALPENLSPLPTIGVRMPNHPLANELLLNAGPLAVSSANLSGGTSTTTGGEVYAQLGGRIPLILDGGRTPGGMPSTVIDCTGLQPLLLRPGPISLEQIQALLIFGAGQNR